ncbi:tyrosine-type recombinase/integrase [Methylococcus geothermalis]|uniref:Tyrosine-type recombinase/integrase n=1 Tax=Methylococcus geothermalis TaxID=2681310 RepID=A0A858Q7N9_9GAMM|nr:site-specific integrase [Methylococcus geothermalis]QJD29878.1 tyrosine-type recombinase/integrase [Methylococcus geothermalis]
MSKLTEKALLALKPEHKGEKVFDDNGLRGVVRVSKAGEVSVCFVWRYRFEGRQKELPCGTWPKEKMSVIRKTRDQARSILESGKDPAIERQADKLKEKAEQQARLHEIQAQLARITVRDLYERWCALELSKRKDGGAEVKRGFEKDVLPRIGEMAAEDVARAHITGILDAIVARGANRLANRTLSELRQMFGFAYVRDIVKADPTHMLKKADFGGKETERSRVLSEDEIFELKCKLPEAHLVLTTEAAVWLMLSTCCRVGELSKARWEHLNFEAATWTIPDENAKNGRTHTVYLSPFALRHFEALRGFTGEFEYLFPSRDGGPIVDKAITKQIGDRQRPNPLKNRSTKGAGALLLSGGKWTPHDLRRTGATIMGELGVRPDVIERCLNHVEENRIQRTYQRQKLETEQREAWRILGERLDLLTRDDAHNVVTMPRRAACG